MNDPNTLLQRLQKSLNMLQQRQAKYGINTPPDLIFEIEDHQTAIALTEQLAAGRLTETAWREQLQPLLVKIEARQATEPVTALNIGGVHFEAINGRITVGGDVVGRDKVTQTADSYSAQASHGGTATVNVYTQPAAPPRDKNLTILLSNVRKIWVEDYLHSALLNAIYLDLGLKTKQDAVPQPFEELNIRLRQPEQPEQDLPPGTRAIDVYRQAGGSLLILGQPGAGKTTTLATLAGDLVVEAEDDASALVPVIFNLSSWAAEQKVLGEWLAEELNRQYQVSRKLAQRWLAEGELALLLDGLDEVAAEQREACVDAINTYRDAEATGPVVVCSRLNDYEALQAKLKLGQAIVLKKLTRQQVEQYFVRLQAQQTSTTSDRQTNGGLMILFERIWQDEALRELVETPLMLNIIIATYAYPDAPPLPGGHGGTLRAKIFGTYSERMFERVGRTQIKLLHPKETSLRYLGYLATQLQAHSLTQFSIGQIRGSWLPAGSVRRQYHWLDGLIGGLIIGLSLGLFGGLSLGLSLGLFGGPSLGLLGGLVYGLSEEDPAESLHWVWGPALKALGGGILGGLLGGGGVGLLAEAGFSLPAWLSVGLIGGLSVGLIGGLLEGLSVGLTLGLLTGLLIGLLGRPNDSLVNGTLYWLSFIIDDRVISRFAITFSQSPQLYWLIAGGALGISMGCFFFFFGGMSTATSSSKLSPAQEIAASVRNMGHFVFLFALLWGLLISISSSYFHGTVKGTLLGVSGTICVFIVLGTLNGGRFLIQYYVRLYLLNWHNLLPFNLIPFFNQAAELIFLQRIGGSYRFIHRSMQEYFAAQYDISVENRG